MSPFGQGSSFIGRGPGQIKSIQRGTIAITGATSNTDVITAVDTTNSVLRKIGQTYNATADTTDKVACRLTFTSATVITANVNTSPGAQTVTVSYEVIEFYPGIIKSIQRGTIALTGTLTAVITAVDTTKSWVDHLGETYTGASIFNDATARLTLTNTVTVTGASQENGVTVGFQVVEFY